MPKVGAPTPDLRDGERLPRKRTITFSISKPFIKKKMLKPQIDPNLPPWDVVIAPNS